MLLDLALIAAPSLAIRNPFVPAGVLAAAVLYRYSRRWKGPRWTGNRGLVWRRAGAAMIVLVAFATGEAWRRSRPVQVSPWANTRASPAAVDQIFASMEQVPGVDPQMRQSLRSALLPLSTAGLAPDGASTDAVLTGTPPTPRDSEELRQVRAQNQLLMHQLASAGKELKEAHKDRGILHFLKATAHDLGIGLGWSAVYFIVFPVLWNGRTPGKRMMGIRIARLNGRPVTWWNAFERFHGYVSCLFGGLIGFLQVFWDHQRQGHHDKIAETVVVEDIQIVLAQPVP